MSRISCLLIALAIVFFLAEGTASAQEHAGHHDQAVAGGGIAAEGWMGMVDRGSNADVNASHLAEDGDALHIKTGPSVAYWRPENTASGTYRVRSEEHTSELQSRENLVCRLLLEKKKQKNATHADSN